MSNLSHKLKNRVLRKNRIRSVVSGSSERPRLSIFVSGRHISAQLIDDTKHATIAAVSTVGSKTAKGNLTEKAAWVGTEIAAKAKAVKITAVVFDRGGRLYHGRVKALAEAAREKGLEF